MACGILSRLSENGYESGRYSGYYSLVRAMEIEQWGGIVQACWRLHYRRVPSCAWRSLIMVPGKWAAISVRASRTDAEERQKRESLDLNERTPIWWQWKDEKQEGKGGSLDVVADVQEVRSKIPFCWPLSNRCCRGGALAQSQFLKTSLPCAGVRGCID